MYVILILLIFLGVVSPVRAADVGDIFDDVGDLLTDRVPPTCDEDFWDVIGDRAWMEAQREVTQNANFLAKPDSVLTYSCFDRFMTHLSRHADEHYPGNPNEAFDGSFLDFGDELFETARDTYNFSFEGLDPGLKNTYPSPAWHLHMESALEILILDTLVSDVSYVQIDPTTLGTEDDMIAYACGELTGEGRRYYIENSNYDHMVLGGRADEDYTPQNSLPHAQWGNCDRMAEIWQMAKCYNAMTEADDGFFTFAQYNDDDGEFRPHVQECSESSGFLDIDSPDELAGVACDVYFHGSPALPFALYWPWSGTPPKEWATAIEGANPLPGTDGGVDTFTTMQNLYDPSDCTAIKPIKTGVVVKLNDGSTYDDAFCMAPGCWYNPTVSTTQCQPY